MSISAQRGAGLVELAIAVLVISVASLGLARAQLAAREFGFSALQRVQAVVSAQSLLEVARSAPGALPALALPANQAPASDCIEHACDDEQWAAWTAWRWWLHLGGASVSDSAGLPVGGLLGSRACVAIIEAEVRVELGWRDDARQVGAAPACSGSLAPGWRRVTLSSHVGGARG